MTIQARRDPQSVTSTWEPVNIPIDGVRSIRSRHIVTRNGYTTEMFRSDWPEIGYDAKHVMLNRWDTQIIGDWHCHQMQADHITVIQGRILVGLFDDREKSPTCGKSMVVRCDWADPQTVVVPAGVYHSFKVLVAPALMLNTITHVYDYENPDHWRLTGEGKKQIPLDLSTME